MRASRHRELERLQHVIVGAGVEALDLLLFFLGGAGQHDDRRFDALLAQLLAGLEAVHVGQAHVEHDGGGLVLGGGGEALGGGGGADGAEALLQLELLDQRLTEVGVVVDDQDGRFACHLAPSVRLKAYRWK